MEQQETQVKYVERNAPRRAIVRSDGALYVLLLIGTLGTIFLAYTLSRQFGVNRLYVQLGLYAVLLTVGFLIYRMRLIDYLYELTDTEFRVRQAVGSKEKPIVSVPLSSISEVGAYRKTDGRAEYRTYRGALERTTAVRYTVDGQAKAVFLNPSDRLLELLSEAADANR